MALYDGIKRLLIGREKAMPPPSSEEDNTGEQGADKRTALNSYNAFSTFEVVNRGVNLIADSIAGIPFDVMNPLRGVTPVSTLTNPSGQARLIKKDKLNALLNHVPNPDQDAAEFWSMLTVDFILTGNAFIYYDGAYMYRIPSTAMVVTPGSTRLVDKYHYTANTKTIEFEPFEIIHIKDNNPGQPYIGASRLASTFKTMDIMLKMDSYQANFFKNSTLLGVAIISKNLLSEKIKQRLLDSWTRNYNPTVGGRKPIILDGDVEVKTIHQQTYKDLEFDLGYSTREVKILKALGVPPILLEAGNNANIAPNLKLFYMTTVLPIFGRYVKALERYFGYDLKPAIAEIPAMLPEAKERADSLTTLTNAGIITRQEARTELRYPSYVTPAGEDDFVNRLILPANIAGSAADKTQGGRPSNGSE